VITVNERKVQLNIWNQKRDFFPKEHVKLIEQKIRPTIRNLVKTGHKSGNMKVQVKFKNYEIHWYYGK
jgi:hypothetical protein